MAQPATPTQTCPQCNGTGVERAVGRQGGQAVILHTRCGTCNGDRILPVFEVNPPASEQITPPPPELALWPFWVPVVLFLVFFLYLWL